MTRDTYRRLLVALAALGLSIIVALVCIGIDAANHEPGEVWMILGPCPTEDSTDCYWDSDLQGNGQGVDFVDIDGVAYYPEGVSK